MNLTVEIDNWLACLSLSQMSTGHVISKKGDQSVPVRFPQKGFGFPGLFFFPPSDFGMVKIHLETLIPELKN